MAASTRAITPTHTDPFLSSSAAPRTPTSLTPALNTLETSAPKETGLLNPQANGAAAAGNATSSPGLSKQRRSPGLAPPPLTGAAAQEEERRHREQQARQSSPNPAQVALNSLLGVGGMSSVKDAPPTATTKLSEPLAKIAKSISIPEPSSSDAPNLQTSPVSVSSFGSVDQTTAPTATAIDTITSGPIHAEPAAAGELTPVGPSLHTPGHHDAPNSDQPSNRSFTYPPPALGPDDPRAHPQRNMSLPNAGYPQGSPKSPSTKRHKCPYCSTDFTRHHNLKSHLLTHSQEKPYECPTCQSRFRRLHDLKRHTKLHTGERPHTCNKCGRRFARGDALARHNKGQGGCAGRRSSFADDDPEGKADAMEGLEYQGEGPDGDRMDEGENSADDRRRSESHTLHKPRDRQDSGPQPYHSHSSTYPPVGIASSNARAMYPPQPSPGGSGTTGTTASSRDPSLPGVSQDSGRKMSGVQQYPGGIIAQGGITESPKPLSPGQVNSKHQSGLPDSASSSLHHAPQHYSRGSGSSGVGLPPPAGAPQLPPIAPMTQGVPLSRPSQSGGRGPLQPSHGPGPSLLQQQVSAPSPSTPASHTPSQMHKVEDLYEYIRELDSRFHAMQDSYEGRIRVLEGELAGLRGQQQQPHPPQHQLPPAPPAPQAPMTAPSGAATR